MTDITVDAQSEVWLREVNCTLPCIHGWEQLQDGQEEPICSHRCYHGRHGRHGPPWPGVSSQSMEPRHERRTCCSLWVSRLRLIQSQGMNTLWTAFWWLWRWSLKSWKCHLCCHHLCQDRGAPDTWHAWHAWHARDTRDTRWFVTFGSHLPGFMRPIVSSWALPPFDHGISAAWTVQCCTDVWISWWSRRPVACAAPGRTWNGWQRLTWHFRSEKKGFYCRAVKWVGCQSLGESSISINPLL